MIFFSWLELNNRPTKANIQLEVENLTWLQSKLSACGRRWAQKLPQQWRGNVKQEWVWELRRLRGAISQICWGFTTQVNTTCSLAPPNSRPVAPRARQQATVSHKIRFRQRKRIFPGKVLRPKGRAWLDCWKLCVTGRRWWPNGLRRRRTRIPPALWWDLTVGVFSRSVCASKQVDLVTARWTSWCQSQSRSERCEFLALCRQQRDVFPPLAMTTTRFSTACCPSVEKTSSSPSRSLSASWS